MSLRKQRSKTVSPNGKVTSGIHDVTIPKSAPVTKLALDELEKDPDLRLVAEIAKIYATS